MSLQRALKLDPKDRYRIEDCLNHVAFRTEMLKLKTPIPGLEIRDTTDDIMNG